MMNTPDRGQETILSAIAIVVVILIMLLGNVFNQYVKEATLAAVVFAMLLIVLLLVWLPYRLGVSAKTHIAELVQRVDDHQNQTTESIGLLHSLQNKVDDLWRLHQEGSPHVMTWEVFCRHIRTIADKIEADKTFKPDIVMSIGRSGSVVGGLLAGRLGAIEHISIDRVNDWPSVDGKRLREVIIRPELLSLAKMLEGKNILCVIAECETGTTLRKVREELHKVAGIKTVKDAVLFRNMNSSYAPDYFAVEDLGQRQDYPFRGRTWPGVPRSHDKAGPPS